MEDLLKLKNFLKRIGIIPQYTEVSLFFNRSIILFGGN